MMFVDLAWRRIGQCCLALMCYAVMVPAGAGPVDLKLSPERLQMSPQQHTAVLNLRNEGGEPLTLRLEVERWTHLNGRHVFTPTSEVLVSPRRFTLRPGSRQVVRAALGRLPDADGEQAYRITVHESVPTPVTLMPGGDPQESPAAAASLAPSGNVFRVSVPVFVLPREGFAVPKLLWTIARLPDNTLQVKLHNDGNAHVQVFDLALRAAGEYGPLAGYSVATYVLAGQAHDWVLKPDVSHAPPGQRLLLKAYTDAGEVEVELPVAAP